MWQLRFTFQRYTVGGISDIQILHWLKILLHTAQSIGSYSTTITSFQASRKWSTSVEIQDSEVDIMMDRSQSFWPVSKSNTAPARLILQTLLFVTHRAVEPRASKSKARPPPLGKLQAAPPSQRAKTPAARRHNQE